MTLVECPNCGRLVNTVVNVRCPEVDCKAPLDEATYYRGGHR